jgi:hypothetical protein
MSSTDTPRPSRARPSRDEVVTEKRRRRTANDTGVQLRLALPEDKLDRNQYAYRWVNDTPGRLAMLHQQDWDVVGDEELGADYSNERHADVAQNRVALKTRLMRKPIDLFIEDHAAKQTALDDEMKAAELGQKVLNGPDGNGRGLEVGQPTTYTPSVSTNKL